MSFFTSLGIALGATTASTATATGVAATALAASVVGTGVSVYGQMQQAKTAERVGENNAKVAEVEALQREMDARENTRRKRKENERVLSQQRAAYAKAGVVGSEGTPLEVMAETAGLLEMEALEIGRQASADADKFRARANASRQGAADTASALRIGAGATLLSGAAQAGDSYVGYKQQGVF